MTITWLDKLRLRLGVYIIPSWAAEIILQGLHTRGMVLEIMEEEE